MNSPAFLLKPLGPAIQQLVDSNATAPISKAKLIPQTSRHTRAHLQRPNSEAHKDVSTACSNTRSTRLICAKPVDAHQHHCYDCTCGGSVDRLHTAVLHTAVGRCLVDVIQTHSGTKVYIEQTIPAIARVVNNQVEHARVTLVFDQSGITAFVDVAIVTPFSYSPGLISAASARPGYMAKRAEKTKFDRHPHINLVPCLLVLEWQSWWSSSWRTTPRWLASLGAERDAQSFTWPGLSHHTCDPIPPVADSAWLPPRHRVRSTRSTPAGAHPASTDLSRTPPAGTDPSGTPCLI